MKLLKLLPILILSLLLACPGYAADGTINDQSALGAQPATDDTLPIWDASAGATKKVTYANMVDIRNADSYGGLTAAVTAIAATETTIIINSAQAVAADLSIPTTLSLICLQSADIVVASTKTLTVNGEIIAGDYQIFSGTGTTTINSKGFVNAKWIGGGGGSLSLADGGLLDLSSITVSSTSGFKLPQSTDVSAGTGEGFAAWDTDNDKLYLGTGTAVRGQAPLVFADGELLDLSSVNGSSPTEGLILPQGVTVSASSAEGQISWDSDNDKLNIGTGTETIVISADSGIMSGDTIWDVAGDLVQGTGNDAAVVLSIGSAGQVPVVNAGATALAYEGGAWPTPGFDAGDFTGSGSMTWTVASGDVTVFAYTILGKTMTIAFQIVATTVAGTPSSDLNIKIPASKTATQSIIHNTFRYVDNGGTMAIGQCAVTGTGIILKMGDGGNWAASTDNTNVYGQITFEIN